ncbi:MAG: RNA polymerase Rpb4 family protein [Candidatus Diapherotrites archaeon]
MIGKKLISIKPLSLFEVKEILSERAKQGELRYEQAQALEYAKKFSKLAPSKAEKLKQELSTIQGLDEDFICKVLDILPPDIETAKLISVKQGSVSEESLKQVVEVVAKYLK